MSPARCLATAASPAEVSGNSSRHAATLRRWETSGTSREICPLPQPLRIRRYLRKATACPDKSQETVSRRQWPAARPPQARTLQSSQRRKMPHSRQHNSIRLSDDFHVIGHDDLSAKIVERLLHRIQISRTVIHDRDHTNS